MWSNACTQIHLILYTALSWCIHFALWYIWQTSVTTLSSVSVLMASTDNELGRPLTTYIHAHKPITATTKIHDKLPRHLIAPLITEGKTTRTDNANSMKLFLRKKFWIKSSIQPWCVWSFSFPLLHSSRWLLLVIFLLFLPLVLCISYTAGSHFAYLFMNLDTNLYVSCSLHPTSARTSWNSQWPIRGTFMITMNATPFVFMACTTVLNVNKKYKFN